MERKDITKIFGFSPSDKIKLTMPYVSVYIHFVWSTKNRVPYLKTKTIRAALWQHIKENGKAKGIFIDFVNGYQSKVMQLIKGEAAHWFNAQNFYF